MLSLTMVSYGRKKRVSDCISVMRDGVEYPTGGASQKSEIGGAEQ